MGDPQTIDGAPPDVIEHSTVVSKHDARAVDELTSLWVRLTDELDFHHGEWYARDERGDWLHVSSLHIHDLLFSLGIGESSVDWDNVERKRIIRQFKDRDRQTPADARTAHEVRQVANVVSTRRRRLARFAKTT